MNNQLIITDNIKNSPPGTVFSITFPNFLHYGIYDGSGKIIHASKKRGCVSHDSLEEFSDGKTIKISSICGENLEHAVKKSKEYIGLKYDLFSSNCEHFVRLAHGLEKESLQLRKNMFCGLSIATSLYSDNKYVKYAALGAALGAAIPSEKDTVKNTVVVGGLFLAITWLLSEASKNE